ncbi:MAG: hypothetical protein ABI806_17995, partial [Candidatus Solibacter sp.]
MPRNPGDFTPAGSESVLASSYSAGPDAEGLCEALDQLLASKTFSRSGQLKRILVYLRDAVHSPDPGAWSETSIGLQAFGRKDFNPKLDTIVRVEMRRLRQKLDEYYGTEGATLPTRLRFEKNTYRPYVEPYVPDAALSPVIELAPAPVRGDPFWLGAALGGGVVAFLAVVLWLALSNSPPPPRVLTESPLWSGFRSSNVVIAVGTPLFFRSKDGFERNYGVNFSEDLDTSDRLLTHQPAFPIWNLLAPLEDVHAAVNLDRFLRSLKSTVTISPARQISYGALAGKRTIVMGQPRTAPLLIDLLADQDFRPPDHTSGRHFAGFINMKPRPGELPRYPGWSGNLLAQSDESSPDYALLTSIRLPDGGEVLNFFGDRVQTAGYIARRLIDPVFVSELNAKVFDKTKGPYKSAQVVFRVDYSRSSPT